MRTSATPLALCALLLAASTCTGNRGTRSPGGITSAPVDVPGIRVETLDIPLSGPNADTYGQDVAHTPNAVEARMIEVILASGRATVGSAENRMARELARTMPSKFSQPTSLVDGLLAWSGIVHPPPRVSIIEVPAEGGDCLQDPKAGACPDGITRLAREVGRELPQGSRFGAGAVKVGDVTRLLVLAYEPTVALQPLPVRISARDHLPIRGQLLGGRTRPWVDVVGPTQHWKPDIGVKGPEFHSVFDCRDGRGVYQLEIFGEGPHGPEVVANFPLYCGVEPPTQITVINEEVASAVDLPAVEKANFEMLNRTREARGLPRLQWSEEAAQIARAHSQDMADHGFVGHRSPTTGSPDDRFARAGIVTAVARENISRGYGPNGIHESLMGSPGHRVNILADDVTHVGIGAVLGPNESEAEDAPRPILLTQNFFMPPGADVPDDPVAALKSEVDQARQKAGLPPVAWASDLHAVAQILADGHGQGNARAAERAYKEALDRVDYETAARQEVIAASFRQLVSFELWATQIPGEIGIGIAKIESGKKAGSLAMVLLMVTR